MPENVITPGDFWLDGWEEPESRYDKFLVLDVSDTVVRVMYKTGRITELDVKLIQNDRNFKKLGHVDAKAVAPALFEFCPPF